MFYFTNQKEWVMQAEMDKNTIDECWGHHAGPKTSHVNRKLSKKIETPAE